MAEQAMATCSLDRRLPAWRDTMGPDVHHPSCLLRWAPSRALHMFQHISSDCRTPTFRCGEDVDAMMTACKEA
jgi:hypothetical protein